MKVSLKEVSQYLDFDLPPIPELVDLIGSRLGAVEETSDYQEKYSGIVTARVVKSEPHNNSDHLHVCLIDDHRSVGEVERNADGLVQVVCGAPNVREGLDVVWIPPGKIVPESYSKDPFKLAVRDIRGIKSNGMLASSREMDLGDNHEGIIELPAGAEPGQDFAGAYGLDDTIIEIENKMFTHRPDCFGQLGIAREIAGICGHKFSSPKWYKEHPDSVDVGQERLEFKVRNDLSELVPRFTAVTVAGIRVGPSSFQLQTAIIKLGLKPINNVVDLTNYYMLLSGQPLHAYDYDKIKALNDGSPNLIVRRAEEGEKLRLLNGKMVELNGDNIVISGDKKPLGLAGIMGGSDTEVDDTTKNIILECATFDMYNIRRSCMQLGVFSDAATRFTKGQSSRQNRAVLTKVVGEVINEAGGSIASDIMDTANSLPESIKTTKVSGEFINQRLGLDLNEQQITTLLENVEFKCQTSVDSLTIEPPFWRTDIAIPEDIIEEVGRLNGYDKLPQALPLRNISPASCDPLLNAKAVIRQKLRAAGANEVLTYTFVHGNLLDKTGQDRSKAYQLANALSPDLQYYRLSLMPSLLDKVRQNIKSGYEEFALFEIGRAHTKERGMNDENLPKQDEYTAFVITANDKLAKTTAPYYRARKFLNELIPAALKFQPLESSMPSFAVMEPYQPGRSAFVTLENNDKFLGIIGEFKPTVTKSLKLPKYCAGFELDTTALSEVLNRQKTYVPLSKYPKIEQDISLRVDKRLPYAELAGFLQAELDKLAPDDTHTALMPLDIYASDDSSDKHVTFRLTIFSYLKTMVDGEVNELLDKMAASAKEKYHAVRL